MIATHRTQTPLVEGDLASGVVTKFKYHGKARDLCARVG
jgi:hypothetical protein